MGLLDIFKSNGTGQFVSDRAFKKNLARQVELAPETLKQLKNFRISSDKYGIHWPEIDEHLSVRAFLQGLNH